MGSLNERWVSNSLMKAAGVASQSFPAGTLYVVGLPIGNLADITLRALWTLEQADAIAAEDTRETRKLLEKFGINAKLISVREHNERQGAEQIINFLSDGCRIAMVTDAGTPAVSDPGARVVKIVREQGYNVSPIPGASAVVTAMSAAGLDGNTFSFVGFVPPQAKARKTALQKWAERGDPFVLYEAPHRVKALLETLIQCVEPSRRIVIAREITKKFETFSAVTAETLPAWLDEHTPRGEYVILVDQAEKPQEGLDEDTLKWLRALALQLPASKLASVAAKVTGQPRDSIYQWLSEWKDQA